MQNQTCTKLTIDDVRNQLNAELEREEEAWKVARVVLTQITKSRAKVRHRISVFDAQLLRAQEAALQ